MTQNASLNSLQHGSSAPNKKFVVLVVDDHPVVREGLSDALSREPDLETREAAGINEALRLIADQHVDIVLADLFLTAGSGLDLIKDIHYRWPKLPVVAMSMHDQEIYAERVLAAGAKGFVEKRAPCQRIVECLRAALRGEFCFDQAIVEKLTRQAVGTPQERTGIEALSDRELEIFELYGQGLSMTQIAERLFLGRKTVETHRERIRNKLGLQNNTDIIRLAAARHRPTLELPTDDIPVNSKPDGTGA